MDFRILKSAAIAFALLAGVAGAQERVVNVFNWSDYIDPKVLEDFTKETGIKVRYDTFDSNEIVEAKLLAGKTGYDVVVPGSTVLRRLLSVGVFQKLDKSKLPNLKNAWPEITQRLAAYDPGNEYAVNYMWGTTGIGYNVAKVKERLGDAPIDSWDIFFKPENLAKLKSCGVHVLDTAEELIPAALKYLGLDPDSKNAADIEKAGELLLKLRPYIQKFHSSEYINALANGEICLVVGWSGDVFQAKARAKEAAEKTKKPLVDIEYVVPKEGAQIWFDSFSIPKDAPNPETAYAFINFMMRPDIAARNTNTVAYANGNLASQKSVDKEILDNPAIYPPADVFKRLYTVTPYPSQLQRTVTRVWTRVKTGR
ncbi:MAG: polyamine ABC transporter substrate-binding protein [Xanthobacteraceae bacterium]|nr:polyamine ABC transporter substrate-binding protein [Xanthobacteraceae bacterium]